MITPYARREELVILIAGAVATLVVGYFLHWWALLPALVAIGLLAFFRDPPRRVPAGNDLLVAPADGHVVAIERGPGLGASGANGGELKITIFLSVFSVHINRSPCAGQVTAVRYQPGQFVNALRATASACNECSMLTLQPRPPLPGPVHVRQIAGVIARRIVCAAEPGDLLAAGQRFGMIKFGSRTELRVPDDPRWEIPVSVGQPVKGGVTVLARLAPVAAPAVRGTVAKTPVLPIG